MAEFTGQNIDVNASLIDAEKRKSVSASPLQTNTVLPTELQPATETYINNLYKDINSPVISGDVSRQDIFPTPIAPVTQQGFSGQFINAPTIAPAGTLFPYALAIKQDQAARDAEKRLIEAQQMDLTISPLDNPEADLDYRNAVMGRYNQVASEYKAKYGDKWALYLKNDPNFRNEWEGYKNIGRTYNIYGKMAQDVLNNSKDKTNPYYSPEAEKAAREYFAYMDKFFKGGDVPGAAEKISELGGKLLAFQNVQQVLKNESDRLKVGIDEVAVIKKNAKDYLGKPLSNFANDVLMTETFKSAFLKPVTDENGVVMSYAFDDQAAKDNFAKLWETEFRTKLKRDADGNIIQENGKYVPADPNFAKYAQDPNEFVSMGVNGVSMEVTPTLKDLNTDALGRARLAFDKQNERRKYGVPVYRKINEMVVPGSGGVQVTMKDVFNLGDSQTRQKSEGGGWRKPIVVNNPITGGINVADGKPVNVSGSVPQNILATGVLTEDEQKKFGYKGTDRVVVTEYQDPSGAWITTVQPINNYVEALDQNGLLVGWNDQSYSIDKENQNVAYTTGNKPVYGQSESTQQEAGGARYVIKGKEYGLDELISMGYSESQVAPYKVK